MQISPISNITNYLEIINNNSINIQNVDTINQIIDIYFGHENISFLFDFKNESLIIEENNNIKI